MQTLVAFSNETRKINVVTHDPACVPDTVTQTIKTYEDDDPSTVQTPSGPMSLVQAFWIRAGAFSLSEDGTVLHDDSYVPPEF